MIYIHNFFDEIYYLFVYSAPIHFATINNNIEIIKLLLTVPNIDVNKKTVFKKIFVLMIF